VVVSLHSQFKLDENTCGILSKVLKHLCCLISYEERSILEMCCWVGVVSALKVKAP